MFRAFFCQKKIPISPLRSGIYLCESIHNTRSNKDGFINDAIKPEVTSLCHDIAHVLIECRRNGLDDGIFRPGVNQAALTELAAAMARRLAPLIGGRYIPKRDMRAERDDAVRKAFSGRNHTDLMREFGISRSLVYSILRKNGMGNVE